MSYITLPDPYRTELARRKQHMDQIIASYTKHTLASTHATYGDASMRTMQAFTRILTRGGKRLRAALAESGYRMFGGKDQRLIDGLGLVLEIVHAYLLIIDDISDRSNLRRGGPAAHRMLESWHASDNLSGERTHFGASLATLAALTGLHQAMTELAQLPAPDERIRAALHNLNHLLTVTCHGQINDLANEALLTRDARDAERVLTWKTAYYSFVNPLQLGAIMAGVPEGELGALEQYGLHAGRAYQISDDILGLFGSTSDTGKNPLDDIREGKRTLPVIYALKLASKTDAEFLTTQLGNPQVTAEACKRCTRLIKACGALEAAQKELDASCEQAIAATDNLPDGQERPLLASIAKYLKTRRS